MSVKIKPAVLIVSHGSRSPQTKKEVDQFVRQLRSRRAADIVEMAFLEIAIPDIPAGIAICARQGAKEIVVLLNFLNSGRHVDQDIPLIVEEAKKKHPGIEFSITRPLGHHPRIVELFVDLLKKDK